MIHACLHSFIHAFIHSFIHLNHTMHTQVVGNGAILETTEVLGPVMKSSTSPKTGGKLTTFASSDSSFEFHISWNKIADVSFVESTRSLPNGEDKILKICRLLNDEGQSACSLILADSSDDSIVWFDEMKSKYETNVV